MFEITTPINEYFHGDETARNVMLIVSSGFLDVLFLNMLTKFILFGKSWRVILCLVSFYLCRMICQQLFILEKPDGYIWDYPGFPSLVVAYAATPDFFFSGHIGFAVICALDNFESKWYVPGVLSIVAAVVEL